MKRPSLWTRIASLWRKPMTRNAYAGATLSRLTLDWITSPLSADMEIRGDLRLLRARSRELGRNNALARRYFAMVATNVVGADGMTLQMRLQTRDGKPLDNQNDAIEEAFADWGRPDTASLDGRLSWTAIQRLTAMNRAQDGEALLQMVTTLDNPYGFALQVLDPDLLDHEYNIAASNGQNEVRMGVELSPTGRPVAYWLWSMHPSDYGARERVRRRVPAADIIHWFKPTRAGQTRGVPDLAPVMSDLNMLRGLQEAELVAARTEASKMGFWVQKGDEGPAIDPNTGGPLSLPPAMDASPGTIDTAPPGYGFETWDPQHPSGNFGPFLTVIQRSIAAGINVPYHGLTGDLSGVNYSSARVGELDARDGYKADQRDMIEHVHCRVFERWLQSAILSGALKLPSYDYTNYLGHEFVGRSFPWVDPKNDIESAVIAIENGIDSRTRVLASLGRDRADVFRDLAEERQEAEALGIEITAKVTPTPAGQTTDSPDPASQSTPTEPARALRLARSRHL